MSPFPWKSRLTNKREAFYKDLLSSSMVLSPQVSCYGSLLLLVHWSGEELGLGIVRPGDSED